MRSERIEINPQVLLGKPVIRGTRIPVEVVVRMLSQGVPEEDLMRSLPGLTREDIQASLAYAADSLSRHTILWLPDF